MVKNTAFLRAINVGGNTPLPMVKLREMCVKLGFKNVRTYIQSGNVLFESDLTEKELIKSLEMELEAHLGKYIPVIIRSDSELKAVVSKNPFPDCNPAQVGVLFFTQAIPNDYLKGFMNTEPEQIVIFGRELYIHYPNGMGRSKLKLPKMQEQGTSRNMNTVTKLVEMGKEK